MTQVQYDYIVNHLRSLGNIGAEKKEEIVSIMLADEFDIPAEIAKQYVNAVATSQVATFVKFLESLGEKIATAVSVT